MNVISKVLVYGFITCLYVNGSLAQNNNCYAVKATVDKGVIEGLYDVGNNLQLYLGIPYAKPPLDDLRWKAPQPLDHWSGVKETKKFGPRAVQGKVYGDMNSRSEGISEDCLYLNVWTPAKRNQKALPVLVYFYGGGFVVGDGSEPRYDGASTAQKGVVVVTVNYRLNVFGFLAHPDLTAEAPYKASGNYGLLDQNAALRWVNKNIAVFGGDPKRVTIAGESAGSISVSLQMASPLSKNIIAGAIGESGASIRPTFFPIPLVEAEKVGVKFVKDAGGYSIKELRAMSTREIYEFYLESKSITFPLAIDGYFMPKSLPEIFNAKEQAQVPLLVGWNSAEIPGMAFMGGLPYTQDNFKAKVKDVYGDNADDVLALYSHSTPEEVELSATALASDRFIVFSTWKWFDLQRKNSIQPVYRYLYSKKRPPLRDESVVSGFVGGTMKKSAQAMKAVPIGAPHACEIEYCMGNLDLIKEYAWTDDDYNVSATMHDYFVNFIKTGNPNGGSLPNWPVSDAKDSTPMIMNIDVESKAIKASTDVRYDLLDKLYNSK